MFSVIGFEMCTITAGARRFSGGCAKTTMAPRAHHYYHDIKLGNRYITVSKPPSRGRKGGAAGLVTAAGLGLRLLCEQPSQCMPEGKSGELGDEGKADAKKGGKNNGGPLDAGDENNDAVARAITLAGPYLSQMGMGGFFGVCSGYALKKIGRLAAVGTGVVFIFLQGLAYKGFIDINWEKVQAKVKEAIDLNNDGKLDGGDLLVLWNKYIKPVLTYHLPGAVGFPVGFLLGFKNG